MCRMRRIVITRRGGPEVLAEREAPRPEPGPEEVRIRVEAAGVNFADLMGRMGLYPEAPPIPYCPGYEVAGTVSAVGAGVESLTEGRPVLAFTRFGGYAEEAVAPASMVFPIPTGVSATAAAAFPVNFATASLCLFRVGGLAGGDTVLIHGGAGGVGTAAVRLALRGDVTVLATAGSPEKVEFLRREGVALAIDHRRSDILFEVMRATDGEGVHLVLDPRGGRPLLQSMDLLAPLGRVVSYGVSEIVPGHRRSIWRALRVFLTFPRVKVLDLLAGNRGILGLNLLPLFGRDDLARRFAEEVLPPFGAGEIEPVVHAELPLTAEGAAEAHRSLHDRENLGKVVLVRP